MVERVRNVIKRDAKRSKRPLTEPDVPSEPKRKLKGAQLMRRYPISSDFDVPPVESQETMQQHMKAISKELEKKKPRDSVLLPLMRSTYAPRRLNDATSVVDLIYFLIDNLDETSKQLAALNILSEALGKGKQML